MKKLIAVSILLTILSAAAFAQLKVSVDADFYPELITATAPLGDAADEKSASYAGAGTFDFLSKLGTWYNSELRLKLYYDDPDGNYNGYVRLKGDGLIADTTKTTEEILQSTLDDYYIKGKVGILSGYYGNTADRGKTNRFQNFSNFMDGVKVDNYGILIPTIDINARSLTLGGGSDTNNFAKNPSGTGLIYAGVGVDLNPVYIGLSGGLVGDTTLPGNPSLSYSQGHAGIRVSGVDIGDIVTFDVIYKISGGDPDNNDGDDGSDEPDGQGLWDNTFGLIANIAAVENLGIGIGYSAFFKVREETDLVEFTYPLFSGIDLRFAFTGVENLSVTFNNNITFAGATGDKDGGKIGVHGGGGLPEDDKDSYFGMYNALALSYQLAEGLAVRAEIGNQLGSYTYDNDGDKHVSTADEFRVVLSAAYTLTSHVGLEGGLAFHIDNTTVEPPVGKGTETGDRKSVV